MAIVLDSQFRGLGLKPPSSYVTDSTLYVYKADKMIREIPGNLVIKSNLSPCSGFMVLRLVDHFSKKVFFLNIEKYVWLCGIALEELLKPAFNIFAFFWIVEVETKGFSETV